MKHKSISFLLAMLMSMAANVAMAYDAEIDGIYYSFDGTEATVTSGDNQYSGDVVIPETITYNETEYSVVHIGEKAFYYCKDLTSIKISNSVKTIGNYAFQYCIGLTFITIPNSVTIIGDTIPSSVTSVGANPFLFCKGLTNITVEEGNSKYDSRNNCNAIIETSSNTLVTGCKNSVIPNSVTSIGGCAFQGCTELTSITIPSSVTLLGTASFGYCSSLTSITIPNSVTSIGDWAFYFCRDLTSITIPNSVTSIGEYAFSGCRSLTSITIPNSVTSIGSFAFDDCSGLTSITIPNSVTYIGSGAFRNCSGLAAIVVEEGNVMYDSRNNCNAIIATSSNELIVGCKGTKIPDSVASLGERAFEDCIGLTSITIPNSVTNIGYWAFCGCSNLISISIPNSVTRIGRCAFSSCIGLSSITIPNSVASIGYYAFSGCSGLTDVYCYAMNVPTTDSNAFNGTPISSITLHVPFASIEAYKAKEPWSGFKEIVICNEVDVENLKITAGNSAMMKINVSNNDANLVGFQMDLTLPEGVGIDKTGCSLSDRIIDENQQLTIGKLESGAYRITSTSLSLTPISGNDGTLLSLKLTAENGCIGGQATISNIIFSTAESEKVVMSDKTFDISILYNLTYKVDGEEYKTSSVAYGIALTPEAEPTKEGYTFGGWSEIPETMPAHDVTVTGTFTINKYKLTYTVDDEEYKNYEVEYGTTITPEAEPTKEGYTFSGWSEIPETMPAHDVTVTGSFSINKYKLTYTVDGEEYKAYEVEYGAAIKPEAEPTKEGYTFSGWSEIPETMPAYDVTVTGTFTINKYKLTYTVDGEEYKNYEVEYGTTITPEAEPTKEGYTFSGWSEIPETMPAHDVTVTGTFGINTYKLTYMIDDAVYKVVDYKYGETITPEPAPEGNYASFEWVGLPETMPAKDVTVYANYVTGITDVVIKENIVRIYSPNGKILDKLQKGLNIVLMKDGTIKKIVVK